jgi:predicted nucleic acid-binding protein
VADTPIFIDANVPMYASGAPHELKEPCVQVLGQTYPVVFATDAEVLQELLHRFRSSAGWPANRARVDGFAELMSGRIEPLRAEELLQAATLTDRYPRLSARDLVHLAAMNRLGIASVVSTDGDFDAVPGIRRLDPRAIATWHHEVG